MNRLAILCLLLTSCAPLPAAEHLSLQPVFVIPSGGWIRCNPHGEIPVYECDPHALDEVTGRTDAYLVLTGCIGVFIASGRDEFYYWFVARAMQAQYPDRHDLAALCGDGCPDALLRELKAEATP